MQLEYDLNVGALYIRLSDLPVVTTDEAGDNTNVDLGRDGHVVGIEVISAAHRWPLTDILNTYKIGAAEAAQLVAYFMSAGPAAAQQQQDVPTLVAELTAPVTVAA